MSTHPLNDHISSKIKNEVKKGQLSEEEIFWRDHQAWLKSVGFALRPRYRPNWVPSWHIDSTKNKFISEDKMTQLQTTLVDAVRELDGLQVMLKKVHIKKHPTEITIATLFSTEPLASDPRNHCIRIYDILKPPGEDDYMILVMPLLLKLDEPSFVSLAEIMEFLRQLLEGLQFMHQQNIAHCDIKRNNIMSDTLRLYRVPPHPLTMRENFTFTSEPILASTRLQKSVQHYLLDFGLSQLHPAGSARLQHPKYGGYWHEVPEFQIDSNELCDPFAVDVFCLGEFMRTRFRTGESNTHPFRGLEFLDDLIADMVQNDPKSRPTMDQVMERFSRILQDLSKWKLMSRASTTEETQTEKIIRDVRYWIGLS